MGTLFRLRSNGKYIAVGHFENSEREKEREANKRQNREERKEGKRVRIRRQGPSTTRRKGDYRLLQCGIGDCRSATAYALI